MQSSFMNFNYSNIQIRASKFKYGSEISQIQGIFNYFEKDISIQFLNIFMNLEMKRMLSKIKN